jgi:uncharacterized membrane protein (GlpM family)
MQLLVKAALSIIVIFSATAMAKKFPAAGGLIATMPLAGALVLVWVYVENAGDRNIMLSFSKGALWGILPTIIFYGAAFLCFRKQLSLPLCLLLSFGAWSAAAFVHYLTVR